VTTPPAVTRTPLADLSDTELAAFLDEKRQEYAALKGRGLALDLTRPDAYSSHTPWAWLSMAVGHHRRDSIRDRRGSERTA